MGSRDYKSAMTGSASSPVTDHGSPVRPGRSRLATVETLRLGDGRGLCARQWAGTGTDSLVLLHGLLDSSEGWNELCQHVTHARIAFDLPGFGYSDAPLQGSIAGYARDVAEGMAQLGVERFILVGHSLGGAVATALAELMPDRIAALVLLAPAGFGRIRLAEIVSLPGVRDLAQAALPVALSSRLAVTAGYMTMVTNGLTPDHGLVDRVTDCGRDLAAGAREGTRAVVDAGRSRRAFYRRQVDDPGPVFAIWGDRDRLVPVSHSRGVTAAFPHAQVRVWRGMGHHPMRERLEDMVELVDEVAGAADERRRQSSTSGGRRLNQPGSIKP